MNLMEDYNSWIQEEDEKKQKLMKKENDKK